MYRADYAMLQMLEVCEILAIRSLRHSSFLDMNDVTLSIQPRDQCACGFQ